MNQDGNLAPLLISEPAQGIFNEEDIPKFVQSQVEHEFYHHIWGLLVI